MVKLKHVWNLFETLWNFLSYFQTGVNTFMFPSCHILLALEPCEWSDLVIRKTTSGF